MKIGKTEIMTKTLFKKGLPRIDDRYGCYFITGRQGTGKSYYAVVLTLKQVSPVSNKKIKVKTNIKSLKLPENLYEIEYFTDIRSLYGDIEEYCIFIIDEISRKYDKNSKTDTQFYAWLNQSRKRHRIVIMITQEWKELPMWLRRPAKFMFNTKPTRFLWFFGLYTTFVGDAENMYLDKDTNEWECPIIKKIIYKRNKEIADMYDTFEAINTL